MPRTILLVDDDALMRRSLAFHLEQAGYQVHTAASAEDAIESVRFTPPDLVVLDIGLPGKDGLVHISELSEDPAVHVNKVEDLFGLGDEVTVMVTDVAPNGKVSLSRRAAITGEMPPPKSSDRGPRGGGDRGPRRDGGDRGPRRDGDRDAPHRAPSLA